MIKVSYKLDDAVLQASVKELAGIAAKELATCANLLQTSYLDGNITCDVTVDEKQARFTIAGEEGVFKDVFLPLNKAIKYCSGESYDFICSLEKKIIFTIKKDSYVEGDQAELLRYLGAGSQVKTDAEIKAEKALEKARIEAEQRKNAARYFGVKEEKGQLPRNKTQLGDRFKVQKTFAVAFAVLGMIGSTNNFLYGEGVSPIAILRNGLIGLISGFLFSFGYTFFRSWFDNQSEKVKVGSIVLFFVTFPAFAIMGTLGAIPYSVYQLVDGKRNRGVAKIIRIIAPIIMGLVLLGELVITYFVVSYGLFT